MPKRIMRGKIKFFSTRPFELHRPRDHALLLLVLYTVYTFRGKRPLPPSRPRSVSFPPSLPVYSLILSQNSRYSLFCRHPLRTSRSSQDRSINDGIVTGSHSLSLSRIAFRETCRSRVFVFILTPLSIPSVPRTSPPESPAEILRRMCWRV